MKTKLLGSTTRSNTYSYRPDQKTIGEYIEAGEKIPTSDFPILMDEFELADATSHAMALKAIADQGPSQQAVEQLQAAFARSMAKHKGDSK